MEDEQTHKAKIDQLIREAFIKFVLMVVQARKTETEELFSSSKSKINKWFNLEIEELDLLTEELQPWRTNLHVPLVLDILFRTENPNTLQGAKPPESTLVERWTFQYEPLVSNEKMEVQNLYKKVIVMVRSLFAKLRLMPGHKLARDCRKHKSISTMLNYKIQGCKRDVQAVPNLGEMWDTVITPYGRFVIYIYSSPNVDFKRLVSQESLIKSKLIIMDYEGSPDTGARSRSNSNNSPLFTYGAQVSGAKIISQPSPKDLLYGHMLSPPNSFTLAHPASLGTSPATRGFPLHLQPSPDGRPSSRKNSGNSNASSENYMPLPTVREEPVSQAMVPSLFTPLVDVPKRPDVMDEDFSLPILSTSPGMFDNVMNQNTAILQQLNLKQISTSPAQQTIKDTWVMVNPKHSVTPNMTAFESDTGLSTFYKMCRAPIGLSSFSSTAHLKDYRQQFDSLKNWNPESKKN